MALNIAQLVEGDELSLGNKNIPERVFKINLAEKRFETFSFIQWDIGFASKKKVDAIIHSTYVLEGSEPVCVSSIVCANIPANFKKYSYLLDVYKKLGEKI